MNTIRNGSFGELFATAFGVSATFQVTMSIIGCVLALLVPSLFFMNGQPATNAGAAIGTVVFMLVFGLIANAAIAAAGSGLVILLRRFLPQPKAAA